MRAKTLDRLLEITCKCGLEELYLVWIKQIQFLLNETLIDETLDIDFALRKVYPFPTKEEAKKDNFITNQGLIG
jgi:hypothetical protein